jgi:crossover junction endodeoxyribonuclease RuvC
VIISGLDPSLTSFGAAQTDGIVVSGQRLRPKSRGHDRLSELLGLTEQYAREADVVAVEGLAMGAKGSAVTDLAGLHWLIRHGLWKRAVPYVVIDPRSRMKWLTGNGNAGKDECLAAAIKRFPMIDITGNDIADAVTIMAMTAAHYGQPLVTMPADRDLVLRGINPKTGLPKIRWPQISGVPV